FFAHDGRAGEGNLVDSAMRYDRLTGFWPASHDVQHASRSARFDRKLSESKCRQRSLLGWLQNDGAAASERWTDLPRSEKKRKIPRDDQTNDADRLTQRISKRAFKCVYRFAVNFGCEAGVVAEHVHNHRHINVARFKNRLAIVKRLKLGE